MVDFAFAYRFRVRWSETDPQGVVYNARYLDYADIAVTEYWRAVDFRALAPGNPFEFHVARAEVDFKKPITPDEMIEVRARTERFGNSSLTVLVEIHGTSAPDDLRAVVRAVQVHVDLETHRPIPIPEAVKACFAAFDQQPQRMVRGDLA